MNSFTERRERIEVEEEVLIPTLDGKAVAETINVKVQAWRDPKDGEIYFDGEALKILARAKARHMGLLTSEQLRKLRERLGLTQAELSELLQIGVKTWTRWESGRERPSRSMNVLLCALHDGRIDAAYLRDLARRRTNWAEHSNSRAASFRHAWEVALQHCWQAWEPADLAEHLQRQMRQAVSSEGSAWAAATPESGRSLGAKMDLYSNTAHLFIMHNRSAPSIYVLPIEGGRRRSQPLPIQRRFDQIDILVGS